MIMSLENDPLLQFRIIFPDLARFESENLVCVAVTFLVYGMIAKQK